MRVEALRIALRNLPKLMQRLICSLSRPSLLQINRPFNVLQSSLQLSSIFLQLNRQVHAGTFKTKSSIKKRFRVKPSGAIMRLQSGKRHLNMSKTRARVNSLGV